MCVGGKENGRDGKASTQQGSIMKPEIRQAGGVALNQLLDNCGSR